MMRQAAKQRRCRRWYSAEPAVSASRALGGACFVGSPLVPRGPQGAALCTGVRACSAII